MALSKIDVANMVTGAVPVANGGTALTSGFVNGGATPAFFGQKASTQQIARATWTKATGFTDNEIDSDTAFDGTTFTVPSGKGGKYFIFATCYCDYGTNAGSDGEYSIMDIYKNGSSVVIRGLSQFTSAGYVQDSVSAHGILDLSASNTIELYVYLKDLNGGEANIAPDTTQFGGYFLGGV